MYIPSALLTVLLLFVVMLFVVCLLLFLQVFLLVKKFAHHLQQQNFTLESIRDLVNYQVR
jgi:hypothetical protein